MGLLHQNHRPAKRYVTGFGAFWLGAALVLLTIVVLQNIIGAWPSSVPAALDVEVRETADGEAQLDANEVEEFAERVAQAAQDTLRRRTESTDTVRHYALVEVGRAAGVSWDYRLLLLSLWFGALGSMVHAGSSFVRFAGNRQLVSSWIPWYLSRPALGAGLAVVFYVVVRAGLATTGGLPLANVSHFTVAAFAALVGLFTQQATKKLSDVFNALFTPRSGDEDADALSEDAVDDAPRIASVEPAWVQIGNAPVPIVLRGHNLGDDIVIQVDGAETPFERLSDGNLTFNLEPAQRAKRGSVEVKLKNSAGTSRPKRILVTP